MNRWLPPTVLVVVLWAGACSSPTAPSAGRPPATSPPPIAAPPLSLTCPVNVSVLTTNTAERVTFASPTVSGGAPPVEVTCTRQSGSMFGVGTTSVHCTARDAARQSSACTFDVKVTAVIPRIGRTRFLAFGDSLTAGEISSPTSSGLDRLLIVVPAASYPTQLQNILRARYTAQPTIQVVNAGQPGEWAQDAVYRFPGALASSQAQAVLLLHGYNDIGTQAAAGIGPAVRAIESMAREARMRGARVYIASLPPPLPGRTHSLPVALVTTYNSQLRSVAAGEGAGFLDLYAGLSSNISRYVGMDGLHPTEAGYFRIAELFFAAIRADLELPPSPQ